MFNLAAFLIVFFISGNLAYGETVHNPVDTNVFYSRASGRSLLTPPDSAPLHLPTLKARTLAKLKEKNPYHSKSGGGCGGSRQNIERIFLWFCLPPLNPQKVLQVI